MKMIKAGLLALGTALALFGAKVESEEDDLAQERRHASALERAMLDAQEVTLLSIASESRYDPRKKEISYVVVDAMEGSWSITGAAKITNRKEIADLAGSLRRSIEENREFGPPPCFSPRHALRFKRGTQEVTVLACFECWQCYTHGFSERGYFQISSRPESVWTAIFVKAGLKIE